MRNGLIEKPATNSYRYLWNMSGMNIVIFGTFYPYKERLSTTTSGLVALLSHDSRVRNITVTCQRGAKIPDKLNLKNVIIRDIWEVDKPLSIVKAAFSTTREKADVIVFSVYLTMFGRKKITNLVGLACPIVLSKFFRRKVVVWLHNFIETQDVTRLGYSASKFNVFVATRLEHALMKNTTLLCTMQSQREILTEKYKLSVGSLFIPYLEGVIEALSLRPVLSNAVRQGPVRILLFGSWGPQKDLEGALTLLLDAIKKGIDIEVTVAGLINSNFPEYQEKIEKAISNFPKSRITYYPDVPKDLEVRLFIESDLLFLPYNAGGGYSAVMNVSAIYDIKVIAYDVSDLRETAKMCNADVAFISPSSTDSIRVIEEEIRLCRKRSRNANIEEKLAFSISEVTRFVDFLCSIQ